MRIKTGICLNLKNKKLFPQKLWLSDIKFYQIQQLHWPLTVRDLQREQINLLYICCHTVSAFIMYLQVWPHQCFLKARFLSKANNTPWQKTQFLFKRNLFTRLSMYKLIYTDSVCLYCYKTFQTWVTKEQEDVKFRFQFVFIGHLSGIIFMGV